MKTILILSLIISGALHAMEKDKEAEKKEADKVTRKTSAKEKALLKASIAAAKSGHPSLAKFLAKGGNEESATLAVHQAKLTSNPAKKEQLLTQAATANPAHASAAKKDAAQYKYDQHIESARAHFEQAKNFYKWNNFEAKTYFELYDEDLKKASEFLREAKKVDAKTHDLDLDQFEKDILLADYEIRYIDFLDLAGMFAAKSGDKAQEQKNFYVKEALTLFQACYKLKHSNLKEKELAELMQNDFDMLKKKYIPEEESSESKSTDGQDGSSSASKETKEKRLSKTDEEISRPGKSDLKKSQ